MNKLVSYDLRKQRNYSGLYEALKSYGAKRILESVWVMKSSLSNKQIGDSLLRHIDHDDGILVADYNDYAHKGLLS